MSSIHGLQVHLRVPVTVVEHHGVGSHEIEAQTSSSGRDQEDELVSVLGSEIIDLRLSVIQLSVAIKSAILVVSEAAVVLEDIKHRREAREDERLTVILLALS